MRDRQLPNTAATASIATASRWLFGEAFVPITNQSHRGDYLRYVLRALYGADYRRRGARMLGVSETRLRSMCSSGERVSRRVVDRLQSKLSDRMRQRRGEVRRLAEIVQTVFAAEEARAAEVVALASTLAKMASAAANTHNPHSRETGRFVSRSSARTPILRELGRAPTKKSARERD